MTSSTHGDCICVHVEVPESAMITDAIVASVKKIAGVVECEICPSNDCMLRVYTHDTVEDGNRIATNIARYFPDIPVKFYTKAKPISTSN